jgi:hypothetical protein
MAVAFLVDASGTTQERYDQVIETLQRAGITAQGRIFHVAGPMEGGGWRVVEVWESQEAVNTFFQEQLMPALQAIDNSGITTLQQVWPVHNMLSGPEHHL